MWIESRAFSVAEEDIVVTRNVVVAFVATVDIGAFALAVVSTCGRFVSIDTVADPVFVVPFVTCAFVTAVCVEAVLICPPVAVMVACCAFVGVNAITGIVAFESNFAIADVASMSVATVRVNTTWVGVAFVNVDAVTAMIFDVANFAFALVASGSVEAYCVAATHEDIVTFILVATDATEAGDEAISAVAPVTTTRVDILTDLTD